MENRRVLVSGASIAGPTLAYWLVRHGFRPTVVERAPRVRAGGNGVDVRGLGIAAAEKMGIMDRVREARADVVGMSFVDDRDRSIARIDVQAMQRKAGSGEVEIMRGDLASTLHEITKDDVEYVFDDAIASLDDDGDGVDVRFARGSERRFDLVVGADGVHSNVRRLAFGEESRFVRFLGHYFATASADPLLGEDRWVSMYNLPGKMAGIYRSGNHAGARAYFAWRSKELDYDYRDVAAQKRILRDAYAGMNWHVPALLAGAEADPDFYFDALTQVRMPSWSSGRVALVGDAAYCASPVTGAGATLSLVGAYRLAGELAAAGGVHTIAFPRYEAGYRPSVERAQAQLFTGLLVPKDCFGIWLRNTIAKLPILGAIAGLEGMFQPRVAEALPEYDRAA